ncbi:hypothetical protein BH24DEI2_BH24DEI2_02720 [soil metagenome]
MGKYYITNKAAADLANVWDGHVGRGGTAENANRLIAELLESFQTLADFPDLGTKRDYLQVGILAMPNDKHMIFYSKSSGGVDILQVLFGGMDFQAYFSASEE